MNEVINLNGGDVMTTGVEYRVEDKVAVLSVMNPPLHTLTAAIRQNMIDAIHRAQNDNAVVGVIIIGKGRGFSTGVETREFAEGLRAPHLGDVCDRIAACSKPVVAAMRGMVLGGGLEMALAADARIVVAGTRIGFPEIKHGIIPGAGATQRLPRLVGAGPALELILSGHVLPIEAAGLFDLTGVFHSVVAKGAVPAAIVLAKELAKHQHSNAENPTRDPGFSDPKAYQDAIRARRESATLRHAGDEVFRVIDCVEAALLLPLEAGISFERQAFETGLCEERTMALLHIHLAETRRAVPGLGETLPNGESKLGREAETVGIYGDSSTAASLAVSLLDAGISVRIIERSQGGAAKVMRKVTQVFEAAVKQGRLKSGDARTRQSRISGGGDISQLNDVGLIIEAGALPIGHIGDVVGIICDAAAKDTPIILTSGVALRAGKIRSLIADRVDPICGARILGAVFQPPAHVKRLVELAVAPDADPAAMATVLALCDKIGKVAVSSGCWDGLIGQRMMGALCTAAQWCVGHGASVTAVDAALNMAHGPFVMQDREDLEVQCERMSVFYGDGNAAGLNRAMIQAGRLGRASGRGFYRYEDGKPVHDPKAAQIIHQWGAQNGDHTMTPKEIYARCQAAMVSQGMQLLAQGSALCAADIDVVMVHGFGVLRASGGPMWAAEQAGLLHVLRDLEKFGQDDAALWGATDMLRDMVKNGAKF